MADYKVIVLGNPNVGKTSLILRWADGIFNEDNKEVFDSKSRSVQVGDDDVQLSIADTAGQERFRTLTSSYYRNTDVILVIFDVTNKESWVDVGNWVDDGQRYANDALIYLVGNKSDLAEAGEERVVSAKELEEYVKNEELAAYRETSAKSGNNVDSLFEEVAREVHMKLGGSQTPGDRVDLHKKPTKEKKKRCQI